MIFHRALVYNKINLVDSFQTVEIAGYFKVTICVLFLSSLNSITTQLQARTGSSIAMRDSGISVDDALLFFRMSDTVRPQATQP